ncbi:two pore domain potassium channel family protein [Acidicapsa ligni]|uniref:two pore domain potassium channel family protein n=1 Tax=Acidicapsa ligni TaxID=542300 RepID=UPI0021DF7D61|nr:two pore domain potassium channel family protein [Acidicapsa ligni]
MSYRLAALVGIILIMASLQDAFEVVLLPRRVERNFRFVHYFYRATWAVWSRMGAILRVGTARESFLGIYGPLSMVLLFACWGVGLITGFGFLQYALQVGASSGVTATLAHQMYMSGDAFFTLGAEVPTAQTLGSHLLIFVEAGIGFGFIGLMVGYLPVLYHHFSQRDLQLIQLDARAGSPPTAGTVLSRYGTEGNLHELNEWLREWEAWAAELIESHSSYPMLGFYRSQHEKQSWLASLAIILDCCTIIVAGVDKMSPLQAGGTFAAARRMLIEIGRSLNVKPIPQPDGRLPKEKFEQLAALLVASGFEWKSGAEVEETMRLLRGTYEPMLQGLSSYLLLPLPAWLRDGEGVELDGRGSLAKRLMQRVD